MAAVNLVIRASEPNRVNSTKHSTQCLHHVLNVKHRHSGVKVLNFDLPIVKLVKIRSAVNPITYGILTFRQLRGEGGGLFGPDLENKVTVNGLI